MAQNCKIAPQMGKNCKMEKNAPQMIQYKIALEMV